MLIIRDAQMEVIGNKQLTLWLRDELSRLFPDQCAARRPSELDQFIAGGVARARKAGFKRDDFLRYLAMEICFGEGFLESPGNEWAREALHAQSDRMQALYSAAVFRLGELAEMERQRAGADDAMKQGDSRNE